MTARRLNYVIAMTCIAGLVATISGLHNSPWKIVSDILVIGITVVIVGYALYQLREIARSHNTNSSKTIHSIVILVLICSCILGAVLIIIPETTMTRNIRGVNSLFFLSSILIALRSQTTSRNST